MDQNKHNVENKNKMPLNPVKKEETVQAGKERMETDGNTHSKTSAQSQSYVSPKKHDDSEGCCTKGEEKSGFKAPMKKPDLSSGHAKQQH